MFASVVRSMMGVSAEPRKFRFDVTVGNVSGIPAGVDTAVLEMMRKGKTSLQTKSTAAVPVTDGTARWLSGDSGAHLILHVMLDRNPDDFTFHSKVFTCKVKDGTTGATLARASVDLANYANIDESNANNSPRGQKDLERSYATTLEFVSDAKKGFFGSKAGTRGVVVSANFVVTAMDITPPPDASPSEKLAFRRKSERHLSLDEYQASDGDSDAASSLGPDEDVADDSQSESASAMGDESNAATPEARDNRDNRDGRRSLGSSKNVSFVDDFGEDDDAEGTAVKTTIDRLSPADAPEESSSGSDDEDDDSNARRTSLESDPSASRLRWARTAMALGVPPPSPPRSEATDSVDGDGAERDASVGKRKKSMLGLYTSPSKKSVRDSALRAVAEVSGVGSGLSRFQAAAKKIQAAGRFGGAFAASGEEGSDAGALSLLDELNATPDVASVAQAETAANDTELTRRHRSAVDEAVNAFKQNAMFAETFGSFESTRALASTLEAALFDRTSDVELKWETETASLRAEILELRRSNEDAMEAMAMMDAADGDTAAEASKGKEKETSDDASTTVSANDSDSRKLDGGARHVAESDGSSAASRSSPVKSSANKTPEKATPPGSPSALFQRASRVGPLEEEIERLTLESQKLKLEALSEKKLATKAQAQALEATKSLQDARASIDASLAKKVDELTSALRDELQTLQGDHDMLASAVETLTKERDAARENASAESARALQTVVDEKAFLVRERDELRAALETSKKDLLASTKSLEDKAVELKELRSELSTSRELVARAEGEAAAHVNDVSMNLETTKASLESATAALETARAELAVTRQKVETAEKNASDAAAVAEASLTTVKAELANTKDRSQRWEASAKAEKASLEALRKSVAEENEALEQKSARLQAETKAREETFASTIESLRAELVSLTKDRDAKEAALNETESRAELAEMAAAKAEARVIEARAELEAEKKISLATLADARKSAELESARVASAHESVVAEFQTRIGTLESDAKALETQLVSKDAAIDAARERAAAAEASVASARVATERALEKASLASKAEKDARLEASQFRTSQTDAETKRQIDAETFEAEIASLRARLEQALRVNVGKVDAEQLSDAETNLGEALAQRDGALENVLAAKKELDVLKAEMDTRWSDARLKAAAEKEHVQTKLDDALRKYESLRNVEAELVEWRRRAAEAEAELDATDAKHNRDVVATAIDVEAGFKARLQESAVLLESTKRELSVEKEKHESLKAETAKTMDALREAKDETNAARRAVETERSRLAEAERAAGEVTERARRSAEESERSVAEAVARARDAEERAKDAEEKSETLSSRLAETLAAAESAERSSAADESHDELALLRARLDAAERRVSVSDAEKADAESRRLDVTRALEEAEARASAAASAAASADAEAQTQRAAAAAAAAKYKDALAKFETEMAAKDDVVERTRARLAEARGRLARLSRGGDSAKGDDSTRGGNAYVGLEPPDVSVSRESSSLSFGGVPKSPAKADLPWNYGAKDARTPRASPRSSTRSEKDPKDAMALSGETTPYGQTVAAASAVAAAATARVGYAGVSDGRFDEKEKEKPHWASPSREYVKSRSGVDAFATPFAKAKPEHVVLAAADAAGEIKRLRDLLAAGKAETERVKRELSDSREHARAAARLAKEESKRRTSAETKRTRDALTRADAELLRTRAELKAAINALAKSDKELHKERLSVTNKVRETKEASLRESASAARVAASRALEAEADRDRLVSEARRIAENALAESVRLRDALTEARVSLDASEEERFELRRALEAHVGALVEAKVDEAETKGELEAMREDVDDMRRRYEAAATRVVELETEKRRARDSRNFERLVQPLSATGGKNRTLRSPRASDASASSFLAFSDYNDSLAGSVRAGNAYDAEMRANGDKSGDKSPRRVSSGSAQKSPARSSGAGTHDQGKKGRASSPTKRRSHSPLRRGGSPRRERRSAGSDDAAPPGFSEKIDVD